jgi:hypothetical protein
LLEAALRHDEHLRNAFSIGTTLAILGDVEQGIGDPIAARSHYVRALRMFRPLGYVEYVAQALCGLAALALASEMPEYALRLVSLTRTLASTAQATIRSDVQARLDQLQAAARQALSAPVQAAAWEAGQTMTLEQVIADALA